MRVATVDTEWEISVLTWSTTGTRRAVFGVGSTYRFMGITRVSVIKSAGSMYVAFQCSPQPSMARTQDVVEAPYGRQRTSRQRGPLDAWMSVVDQGLGSNSEIRE